MPDSEEFSIGELRDAVAGEPEPACFTADGYALFRDRDAEAKQLPVNEIATRILQEAKPGASDKVYGRVFIAHPGHIPTYWKNVHKQGAPLRS
jgi:hypothetical protein